MEHAPHYVFFLVVGAAVVRLVDLNSPLCWHMVGVSGLLAVLYGAGLGLWSRLGPAVRLGWITTLIGLWGVLVFLAPSPLTSAYAWCGVPLACAALRALGRRAALVAVGAISVVLGWRLVGSTGRLDLEMALIPVAAVWGTVALYRAQQRDAAERQRLLEELRSTQDILAEQQRRAGVLAERTRIARDLHDTLAQEIAGSRMLLQAADRDWERRPEAARRQVQVVTEALGEHLAQTRGIIQDLTPPVLARDGLESALRDLCARTDATAGTPRVTFRTEHAACPLPTERAVALLRVTQGLLANACEHARADEVQVVLVYGRQGAAAVEVHDDGTGFDPAAVQAGEKDRGFGLDAARERLVALGGSLTVDSAPGRGTRVRASLREAAGAQARVPVGAR